MQESIVFILLNMFLMFDVYIPVKNLNTTVKKNICLLLFMGTVRIYARDVCLFSCILV